MQIRAYDWIAKHAARQPDKPACVDARSGRALSYAAFDQRARRLASFLSGDLGVTQGDRVAVLATNSSDHLVVQQACIKMAAIFVPLNWRLTPCELGQQIANAEPTVLFHADEFRQNAEAAAGMGGVSQVLNWGEDGTGGEYERGIAAARADFSAAEIWLDDPCMILYTSGATGVAKGVIITHAMTFFNAVNFSMIVRVGQTSVSLCILPLFHTGGINNGANPALHAGGTVVVCPQFEAERVLRLMSDPALGVTHMLGVPANYQMLSRHPDFEKTDLSRMTAAAVGGAPVPLSMHRLWRERGIAFQEGYGLTEGGPSVLISALDQPLDKIGSTGKPVIHGEIRLVNLNGKEAAPDEIGEIWIRGPSVTPGYWNNPGATREAFVDSWFRTGDAAYRDPDGYYYIVDRWKEMYISGGENVYPAEVENVLYELTQIAEVAVVGVADDKWGEVGCAVIVRRDETLTAEDVMRHCEGRLARYKQPRSIVFVDSLPHNSVNKILKNEVRNQLGVGALIGK